MGVRDKEIIEENYGKLWSGKKEISLGGEVLAMKDVLHAFDLLAGDIVAIDMIELDDGRYGIRYYDGDDRCVVLLEFDEGFHILKEHRAHVAEWLEDTYHGLGRKAISPFELVSYLMDLYNIEY